MRENLKLPFNILIWIFTVIFFGGVAYATFASKDYVRQEVKESLGDIKAQLVRIEAKLDQKQDKK